MLLIGFPFPPCRGSGVYRVRAWANALAESGKDVTVLTPTRDYWLELTGDVDDALAESLHPAVTVRRITIPVEYLRQDVTSMSWLHANFGSVYTRLWKSIPQKIFPEVYGHLYPIFVAHGLAVAARKRVDVVMSSGNPYAMNAVAWRLGETLRVPYVVDYHDPWTLDMWKEGDAFPPGHPAWDWERRIITGAALTLTVNEPLAQWYRERYPSVADRVRVVPLAFDEQVLRDPGPREEGDHPLRFGFVGTIRGDLPLEEFLAGWELARQSPIMADATMDFYGYMGFFARHHDSIARRLRSAQDLGVVIRGPVSQTKLTEVYAGLDALVILLFASKYVTAGKVYDYMASGRPVTGVFDPRNATTQAFAPYQPYHGANGLAPEEIAAALLDTARDALAMTPERHARAREVALQHTWTQAMAPVIAEMSSWT